MANEYELNEKDIDSTIRYLQTIDPKNATSETAIALLEEMRAGLHNISHSDPELLAKLYQELKNKKDKSA